MASPALYVPVGEGLFQPTELTRGPWTPDAQHGGPLAALLAGAVEAMPSDRAMAVVRLNVELLRPVPLTPLRVETRMATVGRRVDRPTGALWAGERMVARCDAVRIRRADQDYDWSELPTEPVPPLPDGPSAAAMASWPGFHNRGVEMRFQRGAFDAIGPATVWFRLRQPVVAGQEPTPLQRVAAVADFGHGVSSILDFTRWTYINPDLTVYLHRMAQGEWICLDSVTHGAGQGIALTESALFDQHGRIGRSLQSLLVDPRAQSAA